MSTIPPPSQPPMPPPLPPGLPGIHSGAPQPIPGMAPPGVILQGGIAPPPIIQQPKRMMNNPTTVLMTHIPGFFRYPRNLRDFLYTCCGSVKSVAYSCEIKRSYDNSVSTSSSSNSSTTSDKPMKKNTVAVIRMAHSSGSFSLVRNWKEAQRRLLEKQKAADKNSSSSSTKIREIENMKVFLMYATNELSPPLDYSKEEDAKTIESMWDSLHGGEKQASSSETQSANEIVILKLVEVYETIQSQQEKTDSATTTTTTTISEENTVVKEQGEKVEKKAVEIKSQEDDDEDDAGRKLDVNKVAAAAGGGAYDEEVDPLNAPAVLEAVAQFKKKLEESSIRIKKQRAEYVDKRLAEEVKKARVRILERRKKEEEEEEERKKMATEQASLPPPLPPPPLPPMGALPPPLPGAGAGTTVDSGKRGVSNLPSWMTNKNGTTTTEGSGTKRLAEHPIESGPVKVPRVISEANRDINSRKPGRLDTGDSSLAEIRAANEAADATAAMKSWTKEQILESSALFPPALSNLDVIREFVKQQIVEYLGEEEETLIDFVMNHLGKIPAERTTRTLLDELSMVLEEDAETFVVDLFRKILE